MENEFDYEYNGKTYLVIAEGHLEHCDYEWSTAIDSVSVLDEDGKHVTKELPSEVLDEIYEQAQELNFREDW